MLTKNKVISILQRVIDIQNDKRLTQFLAEFHKESLDNLGIAAQSFVKKLLKGKKADDIIKLDPSLAVEKQAIDQKIITWMNIAFEDKMLDLERISIRDFVCILLDLILYENSHLVNNAFKLLVRFFS